MLRFSGIKQYDSQVAKILKETTPQKEQSLLRQRRNTPIHESAGARAYRPEVAIVLKDLEEV